MHIISDPTPEDGCQTLLREGLLPGIDLEEVGVLQVPRPVTCRQAVRQVCPTEEVTLFWDSTFFYYADDVLNIADLVHYIILNNGILKSNSSIFPLSEVYISQYTP